MSASRALTPIEPPALSKGLTFVELLAVVTTIVVLLALLITGLDKAVYRAELAVCASQSEVVAAGGRPNIVVVLVDDMGYSDLSCFGGRGAVTENIDRLAGEGIRFKSFYVNAPICSPSRVALTTGQYPQRWRITSYLDNRQANARRGMDQWLDPRAPALAGQLQRSGYATGHFGKWHMGGQRDVGDAPSITEYGFDESLTNFEGLGPRVLPLNDGYDGGPAKRYDLGSAKLERGPIRWVDRSRVTAQFVDRAIRFIDGAQEAGRPFYINLWPDDVHSPFFPPEDLRQATDGGKRSLYLATLDAMDQQLGPLFDRIRNDERLRRNTLILIASDNGPEPDAGSSDPFRESKGYLYEGGVRSPLIVWGPGLMTPEAMGTENDEAVVCALDLNRSLYAITGTPLPQDTVLDGEELADALLGRSNKGRVAPIFWQRPPDRPGTEERPNPDLAVREGQWKAYVNLDRTAAQLYDVRADARESTNLGDRHPEVMTRLIDSMLAWHENVTGRTEPSPTLGN